MGIMNKITSGADMTKPKMTSGWVVGATVGVILLAAVFAVGMYGYNKLKTSSAKVTGGVSGMMTGGTADSGEWL